MVGKFSSDRFYLDILQPVVVETRRGPEQIVHILETLARLELTDGLELPQLVGETIGRMPRDATIIAIVPHVTSETAILLDSIRQRGFAVTAILNLHDEYEFAQASGPLLACGIQTHHLKDEQHVVAICRNFVLR